MATWGDGAEAGVFHTERQVIEAVRSLDGLFSQYRQCVRDHETEKEKFKGMFGVWTEELMRAAEKQGRFMFTS